MFSPKVFNFCIFLLLVAVSLGFVPLVRSLSKQILHQSKEKSQRVSSLTIDVLNVNCILSKIYKAQMKKLNYILHMPRFPPSFYTLVLWHTHPSSPMARSPWQPLLLSRNAKVIVTARRMLNVVM